MIIVIDRWISLCYYMGVKGKDHKKRGDKDAGQRKLQQKKSSHT